MALKAGRVGVAPDQVDEFGKINSDATQGYTKQEADAKFETKTNAASTYETKADAADLQPKRLAVPISMLSGSALTVESALQGINDEAIGILTSHITSEVGTFTAESIKKVGRLVVISFNLTITDDVTAWTTEVIKIPSGFEAPAYFGFLTRVAADNIIVLQANATGDAFVSSSALIADNILRGAVAYIS